MLDLRDISDLIAKPGKGLPAILVILGLLKVFLKFRGIRLRKKLSRTEKYLLIELLFLLFS